LNAKNSNICGSRGTQARDKLFAAQERRDTLKKGHGKQEKGILAY